MKTFQVFLYSAATATVSQAPVEVKGATMGVDDGILTIFDEEDVSVAEFAQGQWSYVVVKE